MGKMQATTLFHDMFNFNENEMLMLYILVMHEKEYQPLEMIYRGLAENEDLRKTALASAKKVMDQINASGRVFMRIDYKRKKGYAFHKYWAEEIQQEKNESQSLRLSNTYNPFRRGVLTETDAALLKIFYEKEGAYISAGYLFHRALGIEIPDGVMIKHIYALRNKLRGSGYTIAEKLSVFDGKTAEMEYAFTRGSPPRRSGRRMSKRKVAEVVRTATANTKITQVWMDFDTRGKPPGMGIYLVVHLDGRMSLIVPLDTKRNAPLFSDVLFGNTNDKSETDGTRVYWENGASLTLDDMITILLPAEKARTKK
jgi:hypothetical protein